MFFVWSWISHRASVTDTLTALTDWLISGSTADILEISKVRVDNPIQSFLSTLMHLRAYLRYIRD